MVPSLRKEEVRRREEYCLQRITECEIAKVKNHKLWKQAELVSTHNSET